MLSTLIKRLSQRNRRNTCLHDWTTVVAKSEPVKHCDKCGAVRYLS